MFIGRWNNEEHRQRLTPETVKPDLSEVCATLQLPVSPSVFVFFLYFVFVFFLYFVFVFFLYFVLVFFLYFVFVSAFEYLCTILVDSMWCRCRLLVVMNSRNAKHCKTFHTFHSGSFHTFHTCICILICVCICICICIYVCISISIYICCLALHTFCTFPQISHFNKGRWI